MFGIFYDDWSRVIDKSKCRCALGIRLDLEDAPKANEFLKNNPTSGYKVVELPETEAVYAPSRMHWLAFINMKWKVYKPMFTYARREYP